VSSETPDLALASERARVLSEARVLVDRIAEYTALFQAWAEEEDADAKQ
jgi:hypothetical protein